MNAYLTSEEGYCQLLIKNKYYVFKYGNGEYFSNGEYLRKAIIEINNYENIVLYVSNESVFDKHTTDLLTKMNIKFTPLDIVRWG